MGSDRCRIWGLSGQTSIGDVVMSEAESHTASPNHLDFLVIKSVLADELSTVLRETVFSSGLRVSPRRITEIGKQFASEFLEYYAHKDGLSAQAYGEQLANEGLGPRSILQATEALQRICIERSSPRMDLPFVACGFNSSLLLGYFSAREKRLLEDQERSRKAQLAVLGRQLGTAD